jgi:hypothetical protein
VLFQLHVATCLIPIERNLFAFVAIFMWIKNGGFPITRAWRPNVTQEILQHRERERKASDPVAIRP